MYLRSGQFRNGRRKNELQYKLSDYGLGECINVALSHVLAFTRSPLSHGSETDSIFSVVQKSEASTHFCFYLRNALTTSNNFWHTYPTVYRNYSVVNFL